MPRADFMLNRNYTFDTSQITCRGLTNAILSLFLSFTKSLECVLCAWTQHVCRWQISKYTGIIFVACLLDFSGFGPFGVFLDQISMMHMPGGFKALAAKTFSCLSIIFSVSLFLSVCLSVCLNVCLSISVQSLCLFVSASLSKSAFVCV